MSGKHARTGKRALGAIAVTVCLAGLFYLLPKLLASNDQVNTALDLSASPTAITQFSYLTTTATATVKRDVRVTKTITITRTAYRTVSRDYTRPALPGSAQAIAKELLAARGWSGEWTCLNSLINRESGWNVHATNPSSGAYGIPQSLPGSKMASAGADWRDNPRTQLVWMMGYIKSTYSTPCGAWAHSQRTGWY